MALKRSVTYYLQNFDRLARVRENQRKSRARKQEYIRELEQRLAICKEQAQREDIQHRLAMQKIEAENRHLRNLLGSLGIPDGLINEYLQSANQGTLINRKVAIPTMRQARGRSPSLAGDNLGVQPVSVSPNEPPVPAHKSSRNRNMSLLEKAQPGESESPQKAAHPDPHLCTCPSGRRDLTSFPSEEDVLNSTLCAIAEELVGQYNTRGADLVEIKQKLWSGFRAGNPGGGCRVQNQILFQVLDEISNS